MNDLTNDELLSVNGGAFKIGICIGIVAVGAFIAGVIDGIIRPLKCH